MRATQQVQRFPRRTRAAGMFAETRVPTPMRRPLACYLLRLAQTVGEVGLKAAIPPGRAEQCGCVPGWPNVLRIFSERRCKRQVLAAEGYWPAAAGRCPVAAAADMAGRKISKS